MFVSNINAAIAVIIGNRSNVVHLIINDANGRTDSCAAGRGSIENNVADSCIVIRIQRHLLGRTDGSLIVHADDAVRFAFHVSKHACDAIVCSLAAAKGNRRMLQIVLSAQVYIVTSKDRTFANNYQAVNVRVMHAYAAADGSRCTAGVANSRDKVFSFAIQSNIVLFSSCGDIEFAFSNIVIIISYARINLRTFTHNNLRIVFDAVEVDRAGNAKLSLIFISAAKSIAASSRSRGMEIGIVRSICKVKQSIFKIGKSFRNFL